MGVTSTETVEATHLPMEISSQKAKLISLSRALQVANIYTNSKYASLIAHTDSVLWKERGFLTTKGAPIVNGPLIDELLEALQLPAEVSKIYCWGH